MLSYWSASLMEDVVGYSRRMEEFLKRTEEEYRDLAGEIFAGYLGLRWGRLRTLISRS